MIFLLVILTIPTVGYFLINQNSVQNYLVQRATSKISAFLGAPVSIRYATLDLFNNIIFEGFCVQTPQHDTILYTKRLEIKLNTFSLTSKYLEFKKVTMEEPDINFYIDSTSTINFQFIVNKLESKDTLSSDHPMIVSIKEINLKNADFSLKSYYKNQRAYGINFSNIHLKPLNVKVANFRVDHGVSMSIKKLSAVDQSGFVLDQLACRFKIDKRNMIFNNLDILTPKSDIEANQVAFNFNTTKEFKPIIFGKKVKMEVDMEPSMISTDDLAWFLPFLKDNHLQAKVSGTFKGRFGDLHGRNLDITYGKHTHIKGNLDISGLPDIASSFLHVDIKSLYTTPSDIESVRLPHSKKGRIILPNNFNYIKYITYKGKFTGFLNDFVAYGKFSTNLGNVESDLSLKPDTANYFSFNGTVKTIQFDIGRLLDKSDVFGKISLNVLVNGNAGTLKNPKARLDGMINSFMVNNYNYQNVKINGTLSDNTYDGSLSIADPNVTLDFMGNVNLSSEIPKFNFKANVKQAKLYKLNLEKKDSSAFVSFFATADFEGSNIDNLNGEIKLWNSSLRRGGKEIQINDFLLFTKTVRDTNRIILRSDLADAEVWGSYQFKELKNSFVSLIRGYLPAIVASQPYTTPSNNNFKFDIELKNTRQVTDFFAPGLYVSKDTRLAGTYSPTARKMDFLMYIPLLQHNSKKWYNVTVNGKTLPHSFSLIAGSNHLRLTNQIDFKNFSLEAEIKNDSINTNVHWNNWDTVAYKGNISLVSSVRASANNQTPSIQIDVKPSQFILKDTVWNLKSGRIAIDSEKIKIDQFVLSHLNQNVKVNGSMSRQKNAPLSLEFNNVDLNNISTILNTEKIALNGIIKGNLTVSNLYENPVFHAALAIDSFALNHETLGNTNVTAEYNMSDNKIQVQLASDRASARILDIKGSYATVAKSLDFDININKLRVNIFEPYLSNIFSDIRGTATGSLRLTGTWANPEINGTVKIQKGTFMVNYLKTRYNFTHTVDIKKNTFIFKKAEVYDQNANKAIVDGQIEYRNLKDIYTNIHINATDFACLNTTDKDNNLYYGQGYATGFVDIRTSPKAVNMDIDATTTPNTLISIPLTNKTNFGSENSFIRYKKHAISQSFEQYEKDTIIESKQFNMSSNFKMNCVLHVTPDAGMQIIFDQNAGDMIKGKGSGVLTMTFESGTFNMYGKYTIEDGNYLFTLPNVFINKQFAVDQGGTISWDGNPFDAILDASATYKLRASLYPSLVSDQSYAKLIPVECKLSFKDKLLSPSIRYDIDLPNADQESKTILESATSTEESKSRQFLALLFAQNFITDPNAGAVAASNSFGNSAASSGFEFLSNQFSRILSQISKDVDIGFNYHPGDKLTANQVELMFKTQFFKGRVTVNANVEVVGSQPTEVTSQSATYQSKTNVIPVGDIEVKLNKNGKLRLKAFNRYNQQNIMLTDMSAYTQGVGIFYKEDFNSFQDLMKNYFDKLFGKKEEPPAPIEETEEDSTEDE